MVINSIRIYAEVLEQGLDFKEYIEKAGFNGKIYNIYTKKGRKEFSENDSLVDRIRKCKDVDVLISAISDNKEYPLLLVEYSTAVPTDDHKMQRSDVYYWSKVFKAPMLKIYPSNKGMEQDFGGGDKITDELEEVLSYRFGGLFYAVQWETLEGLDTLKTKKNALSCIHYSEDIFNIIKEILCSFEKSETYDKFFNGLRNDYKILKSEAFIKYEKADLKSVIVDSTRFKWDEDTLTSKINRFGHAMDPDRGVLYFSNMLNGVDQCTTEIQVNRSDKIKARGGYGSLFDGTAHENELLRFVINIINTKNNVFSSEDALYVFRVALNIESYDIFKKVSDGVYIIKDDDLYDYLCTNPSMTSKCIFFLSTKLILTDKNRNKICEVKWNSSPINRYLDSIKTSNFKPLEITELSFKEAKEDVITFASVELYKKLKCELLAVSYPGAQGDRCILSGSGRNVLRDYIDIIAYKIDDSKLTVFLEECKDEFTKSAPDVAKLKNIISDDGKMDGLVKLLKKTTGLNNIDDSKISVGAKVVTNMPSFDVDYIFMFGLNTNIDKTIIDYTVAVIDTSLVPLFEPLTNKERKLKGTMEFDKIYIIK